MDLRLYGQVLWRYRILIAIGGLIACAAAFLSFARVEGSGVAYRDAEVYGASQDLYVTEQGFQEGRRGAVTLDETLAGVQAADPARLAELTTIYVQLVDSDPVRRLMLEDGPIEGTVFAEQFTTDGGRNGLPFLRITGYGDSPNTAIAFTERQSAAFQTYVRQEQNRAGIPREDRVVLSVLRQVQSAELVEGRSLTPPIVIFVAIMAAFVAVAFVTYNLRSSSAKRAEEARWRQLQPDDIVGGADPRVRTDAPTGVVAGAPAPPSQRSRPGGPGHDDAREASGPTSRS